MAQPSPQFAPAVVIKIKNGQADNQDAYINIGQAVEIHNEDNTPYALPFTITNPGDSSFPLSLILPAGGKLDLIGLADATCEYFVNSAPFARGGPSPKPMDGPYTIGIGSGEPGGGKR